MTHYLPAATLMFHRLRNRQIGIDADIEFVRGLHRYAVTVATKERQAEQEQLMRVGRASFLNGVIQEAKGRAEALIEGAKTPEEKRAILADVTEWLEVAKKSEVELEALNNG